MKVNTVNVIEYVNDAVLSVRSFMDADDNERIRTEGNAEAEALFKECVKENGDNVTDEEMEACLEDGYFEQGDYQVFLTHSS